MAILPFANQTMARGVGQGLGQALDPRAVAAQAQPNAGASLMQKMQEDPYLAQVLLNVGASLLNPQSFQRPGGRIAAAAAGGLQDYTSRQAQTEDKERERAVEDREQDREDRKLDITEDQFAQKLEQEADQFSQQFGLKEEELEARKAMWAAQARKYSAEASKEEREREQGVDPNKLTGRERITNQLAQIMVDAGVPENISYITAFDIFNEAEMNISKARAKIYENLGMMARTERGEEQLNTIIQGVEQSFTGTQDLIDRTVEKYGQPTPTTTPPPDNVRTVPEGELDNQTEVAPGVTEEDVVLALEALSKNEGRRVFLNELSPSAQQRLFERIRQIKEGQQ